MSTLHCDISWPSIRSGLQLVEGTSFFSPKKPVEGFILTQFMIIANNVIKQIEEKAESHIEEKTAKSTPSFRVNPAKSLEACTALVEPSVLASQVNFPISPGTELDLEEQRASTEKATRLARSFFQTFNPVFSLTSTKDELVDWGGQSTAAIMNFACENLGFIRSEERVSWTPEDLAFFGVRDCSIDPTKLNCVQYALLRGRVLEAKEIIFAPPSDQAIIEIERYLKEWGYRHVDTLNEGDLVLYFHGERPSHMAAFVGGGLVESKLGLLNPYSHRHPLFSVPMNYGKFVAFYRKSSMHQYTVELERKLCGTAIQAMQAAVKDNQERMEKYASNPIHYLARGCWYPIDYQKALKVTKRTTRLNYLIEKGAFFHGLAPSDFFCKVPDKKEPTNFKMLRFVLKEGKTPSDALEAIQEGLSLVDCGTVCQIAFYKALQIVLERDKFDALFSSGSKTELVIHFNSFDNPVRCLFDQSRPSGKFKIGQIVIFNNHSLYNKKHLIGDMQAIVTICCDDTPMQEKFIALGLDPLGMTLAQINDKLRKKLNAEPLEATAIVTESVARQIRGRDCQYDPTLAHKQLSFDEFSEQQSYNIAVVLEINSEKVLALLEASIEEAQQLLVQYNAAFQDLINSLRK